MARLCANDRWLLHIVLLPPAPAACCLPLDLREKLPDCHYALAATICTAMCLSRISHGAHA